MFRTFPSSATGSRARSGVERGVESTKKQQTALLEATRQTTTSAPFEAKRRQHYSLNTGHAGGHAGRQRQDRRSGPASERAGAGRGRGRGRGGGSHHPPEGAEGVHLLEEVGHHLVGDDVAARGERRAERCSDQVR